MKKYKLITLCLLAAVVVAVGLFALPFDAEAATYSGTCGENLTWTLDAAGTLTISGTGPMYNYRYDYSSPTDSNHPWKNVASSIKKVVIEDGVTTIGNYAFYYCTGLTTITIPDSVTTIGEDAFYNCTSLTSFYISDIAAWCKISFGNSYANPLRYVGNLYVNNELVTDLVIPEGVTTIGNYAFYNCTNLTSVTIGNGVTSIGNYAFYYCKSLTSVTIPDSVTTIGSSAFYNCTNLTSVTIPDSVTTIGEDAFWYCAGLTGIWVDAGNTAYSSDASGVLFNKDKTTLIQAPSGLAGAYTIPSSVTTIGYRAFYYCYLLTSVTIPDSVTSIGNYAFDGCDSLTSVTIGNSVTTIGNYAFSNCTGLTEVTIGNGVTSIGKYAFYYCRSLTSVTIPDSVTAIGSAAFYGCYRLSSVTIGSSVTTIGEGAFYECSSLTSITIPDSVTTIGYEAFDGCYRLTSVTIGNGVTSIGDDAFAYCFRLTDVYYAGTQTQWNAISIGSGNNDLTNATIHYNHIHDYTLLPATTVAPTCTKDGYIEYTCAYGDTYREILPALGHTAGSNGVVTAPTCTQQGYTTSTCTRCGTTTVSDYVAAMGHDYSGAVVTVAPTCTEEGYTATQCIRCDAVEKKDFVDSLGHKMAVVPAVPATCTQPGLTVGTACERCGLVGVAQKEVAALGGNHDYTADPTICGICGNVRATLAITTVILRPSCAGIYFQGAFTFDKEVKVARYGIAVSVYNKLPVADDSDERSLYTASARSALITDILGTGASNAQKHIYARAYALLEDGTFVYGDVVCVSMRSVVEAIDTKVESLTAVQKDALNDMYQQYTSVMTNWNIPNIKQYGQA